MLDETQEAGQTIIGSIQGAKLLITCKYIVFLILFWYMQAHCFLNKAETPLC